MIAHSIKYWVRVCGDCGQGQLVIAKSEDQKHLVELTQSFHNLHTKAIHINPNTITSSIDRIAFKSWRKNYWIQRAKELGGIQ